MEIILGIIALIVVGLLWHANTKKTAEVPAEAPYKVETPVEVSRVETVNSLPVEVTAVEGAGVVEVAPAKKPAAKKPATPKAKPAAIKAPAKKPAAKPVAAKKPVAKKPAVKAVAKKPAKKAGI